MHVSEVDAPAIWKPNIARNSVFSENKSAHWKASGNVEKSGIASLMAVQIVDRELNLVSAKMVVDRQIYETFVRTFQNSISDKVCL